MSVTSRSFGSVLPPLWSGETAYLLGGGPSRAGFDVTRLRGKRVIAVNDSAYRHAPWASALFSLDKTWIVKRREFISQFAGEKYLAVAEDYRFTTAIEGVVYLHRVRNQQGLSTQPDRIFMGGGNSGYGALNLAFLKGAARIVLLGYDYSQIWTHCFPEYPWNEGSKRRSPITSNWARMFNRAAQQLAQVGVEVLNASLESTITAFPKISLSEVPL